jgi:hypothetical protein
MKCNTNSVISLQIMLFGTYNIDSSSFEHYIYDIRPYKIELQETNTFFLL